MLTLREYQKRTNDEIWKTIPGFGDYEVSNHGRVRRVKQSWSNMPKILQPWVESYGYHQVELSNNSQRKTFRVHRLVLICFVGNPQKGQICNHKDGNKQNNKLENLEWCNHSYNMKHSYDKGLHGKKCGEKSHLTKLKNMDVIRIRRLLTAGDMTCIDIARQYNISRHTVRIRDKKSWINI